MLVKCAREKNRMRKGIGNVEDGLASDQESLLQGGDTWLLKVMKGKPGRYLKKSIPGFQNSKRKDPQAEICLEYSWKWKKAEWPWSRVREGKAQRNQARDTQGDSSVGPEDSRKDLGMYSEGDGKSSQGFERVIWSEFCFNGIILATHWEIEGSGQGWSRQPNEQSDEIILKVGGHRGLC